MVAKQASVAISTRDFEQLSASRYAFEHWHGPDGKIVRVAPCGGTGGRPVYNLTFGALSADAAFDRHADGYFHLDGVFSGAGVAAINLFFRSRPVREGDIIQEFINHRWRICSVDKVARSRYRIEYLGANGDLAGGWRHGNTTFGVPWYPLREGLLIRRADFRPEGATT